MSKQKQWGCYRNDNLKTVHVAPLNEEHSFDSLECKCTPKPHPVHSNVIIHNSFDQREIIEEAYKILNG